MKPVTLEGQQLVEHILRDIPNATRKGAEMRVRLVELTVEEYMMRDFREAIERGRIATNSWLDERIKTRL